MSLGMALAGLTGFKATQNKKFAVTEPVKEAKAKKKKTRPKHITGSETEEGDLGSDVGFPFMASKSTIPKTQFVVPEPVSVAKAHQKETKPKTSTATEDEAKPKTFGSIIAGIDISKDLGFYKAILRGLGVKETPEKIKFLKAWRQGEGGMAKNNPFNTTKHIAGTVDTRYNSKGVRNYPDRKTGIEATVKTLALSYYKEIVDLLKKDDVTAHQLAHTKALKKWGTGEMVKKVLAGGRVNPPNIA